MLVVIFLLSNSACDNLKGLTISQLDTKNNIANQFKVTEVDKKKCTIQVEDIPSISISQMHGAFCLSADEFARYKAKLQTDCKNQQIEQIK